MCVCERVVFLCCIFAFIHTPTPPIQNKNMSLLLRQVTINTSNNITKLAPAIKWNCGWAAIIIYFSIQITCRMYVIASQKSGLVSPKRCGVIAISCETHAPFRENSSLIFYTRLFSHKDASSPISTS